MSVCNKNFNLKIFVQTGYLEFSLVAVSKKKSYLSELLFYET